MLFALFIKQVELQLSCMQHLPILTNYPAYKTKAIKVIMKVGPDPYQRAAEANEVPHQPLLCTEPFAILKANVRVLNGSINFHWVHNIFINQYIKS